MCNNNCCTCNNINNDESSQEIIYTAVCNSASCQQNNTCTCTCCANRQICENDPSMRIDGIEERMQECCEDINSKITQLQCDLTNEIERSTEKDNSHDHDIADLFNREGVDVNYVEYVTNTTPKVIKFWHVFPQGDNKENLLIYTINVEPFLKDGILDSVNLQSDGHTLHFVWNIDAGKQDSYVDLDSLVTPISTGLNNLKDSIVAYNPQLTYDGASVTVGQIDGKLFKVHLEQFPTLIQSVQSDPNNNRIIVTTNKGGTLYIPIENSNYLTRTDAANTYESIQSANNHIKNATINSNIITFTRQSGSTFTVELPTYSSTDHYVTSGALVGNTLKLTRDGVNGTVDIDLSGVSGTTNVTYNSSNVSIQNAINGLVQRIESLEGLWQKNSDGLIPVESTRKVYGAGFYDTTIGN